MRLESFAGRDRKLGELLPGTAPTVGTVPTMGTQQQQAQPSGLATGQMDPAQAAQAAQGREEQKKQVRDQIKSAEQQLVALRRQLADLG